MHLISHLLEYRKTFAGAATTARLDAPAYDECSSLDSYYKVVFLGYCPQPVTVYVRGAIKGYI